MESLFIVNPRRKKRRKGKMPAGLRKYWASRKRAKNPRRVKRRRARARNPKRRRSRAMVVSAPRRRKRRANPVRYGRRKRRANPKYLRRSRRARRRNPIEDAISTQNVLLPAAIGAIAAIGTQVVYGALQPRIPAQFNSGPWAFVAQALVAVVAGVVVGKVLGERDGQIATAGALTVAGVTFITPYLQSAFPTIPGLAGLGSWRPYMPYMGAYSPSLARSSTLRSTRQGRLGWISPAPKLGAYMPQSMPAARAAMMRRGMGAQGMGAYMPSAMGGRSMAMGADLSGSGFNGLG